jgi:NAD(P)-dependent dehydrogenase (short-subunit alcohol dehydrogenase family)
MRIALEGRRAVILGGGGEIGQAIAAALARNGARVAWGEGAAGEAWLLVQISAGLAGEADADEVERFAAAARAWSPGVGRIIHVISAAGLVPLRGAAAHSARQAALASLTRALAMELAPETLVNAVAVGCDPRMASHAALRRTGSAEEIARATLFLADPANTYTTGHVMAVDGGWSIGYARDF